MSSKMCFVCLSQLTPSQSNVRGENERSQHQLDAMFILKHILQFSSELILDYQLRCGNPGESLCLCKDCRGVIQNVRSLFTKLEEISRRFEGQKWEVQEKIRNSTGDERQNTTPGPKRRGRRKKRLTKPKTSAMEVDEDMDDLFGLRMIFCARKPGQAPAELSPNGNSEDNLDPEALTDSIRNGQDSAHHLPVEIKKEHIPSSPPAPAHDDFDGPSPSSNAEEDLEDEGEGDPLWNPKEVTKAEVQIIKRRGRPRKCQVLSSRSSLKPKGKPRGRSKPSISSAKSVLKRIKGQGKIIGRPREVTSVSRTSLNCEICGKGPFTTFLAKVVHVRHVHDKAYKKTCPHCDRVLSTKGALTRHLARVHNIGSMCIICGKVFNDSSEMEDHKKRMHPNMESLLAAQVKKNYDYDCNKPKNCEICGHTSASRKAFKVHLSRIHGIGDLKCEVCGEVFAFKSAIEKHKLNKHGPPLSKNERSSETETCAD